jgi:parallel beta-helix repeat protein
VTRTYDAKDRPGKPAGRTLATTLLALCAVAAAPATADAVSCGDVIPAGATVLLQADLICDEVETALVVKGPAVLDLNGFSIRCKDTNGNGREVIQGVALEGAGAVLRNGVVRDCRQAVAVRGTGRHQVIGVRALFWASDGFRVDSDRNHLTGNESMFNGGLGYAVRGKANVIAGNTATGNRQGFDVEQRNTIELNVAAGNELTGFFVRSRNAKLRRNRALGSSIGFQITGRNNLLERNQAESNRTGFVLTDLSKRNRLVGNEAEDSNISGFIVDGLGNRLQGSRAEHNGAHGIVIAFGAQRSVVRGSSARFNGAADLSDANANCGTNRWRNNSFGSSDQACIQ